MNIIPLLLQIAALICLAFAAFGSFKDRRADQSGAGWASSFGFYR